MRLVSTTNEGEKIVADFMATGYWAGELYLDKKARTHRSAYKGINCLAQGCTYMASLFRQSSAFMKLQKRTVGNFKGGSGQLSAMMLIDMEAPGSPKMLWSQLYYEEPPIGQIFGALGADKKRQAELQERALSAMAAMRKELARATEDGSVTSTTAEPKEMVCTREGVCT